MPSGKTRYDSEGSTLYARCYRRTSRAGAFYEERAWLSE